MARQISEIYNELVLEKQNFTQLNALQPNIDSSQTLLNDLNTSSKVAVWRLIFFVVAVGIWSLENIFDIHKTWIENRAKEIIPGNIPWYAKQAKDFQNGDTLVYLDNVYKYATINEANKIIKLVAVSEGGGKILIKVAKLISNLPEQLTTPELEAFAYYVNKIKFAGITVLVVSRPADLLKISYRIYYDPLLLNSNGEFISNNSIKPVEDVINEFIKNIPFDGIFSFTTLTDKIKAISGVINPIYELGEVKFGAFPYQILSDNYIPNGGYLKIDEVFPLENTIQYLPYLPYNV